MFTPCWDPRTDFRHHISLTPSRIDLGKMERSMRGLSGGNVARQAAAVQKVEEEEARTESKSEPWNNLAQRLYKVTKR